LVNKLLDFDNNSIGEMVHQVKDGAKRAQNAIHGLQKNTKGRTNGGQKERQRSLPVNGGILLLGQGTPLQLWEVPERENLPPGLSFWQ